MARGDLYHYLVVFTIDGVKHVMRGYVESAAMLKTAIGAPGHLGNVLSRRQEDIPEENIEVVSAQFAIDPAKADEIQAAIEAENAGGTAKDLSPAAPNLLLHKSKETLKAEGESADIGNIADNLR